MEELKNKYLYKGFLLLVKYIPHVIAIMYITHTFLSFIGIDSVIISYFAHLAILPWICLYLLSIRLKFCYIHRFPLYYIMLNELLLDLDYYITIPVNIYNLVIIYILLIANVIFNYSIYYILFKLK